MYVYSMFLKQADGIFVTCSVHFDSYFFYKVISNNVHDTRHNKRPRDIFHRARWRPRTATSVCVLRYQVRLDISYL